MKSCDITDERMNLLSSFNIDLSRLVIDKINSIERLVLADYTKYIESLSALYGDYKYDYYKYMELTYRDQYDIATENINDKLAKLMTYNEKLRNAYTETVDINNELSRIDYYYYTLVKMIRYMQKGIAVCNDIVLTKA